MIRLRVERMIRLRGHLNPLQFLMSHGYSYRNAYYILKEDGHTSVKLRQVENLCRLLRCTPNDLLEWQPNDSTDEELSQPLAKLCRSGSNSAIISAISDIPPGKLDKAVELLRKIGEEG